MKNEESHSTDKLALVTTKDLDYGSTTSVPEEDNPTWSLEDIYLTIGIGRAQWLYWLILGTITYFEGAEMVVISTILPILRCEWDLDVPWETAIGACALFFSAIGSVIASKLSDKYGRKRILSCSIFFLCIFCNASALAKNKVTFLVLRCCVGVFTGPLFTICIAYTVELGQSSRRETGSVFLVLFYNTSIFTGAVIAALVLKKVGWRWYIVLMAAPLVVCFALLYFVVPESPRYLVVSGKKEQALKEIRRIAQMNGVELPGCLDVVVHESQDLGSISALFSKQYRKETILLSLMFFFNLLVIFAVVMFVPLALYSGFCGGDGKTPEHQCLEVKQESLVLLSVITFSAVLAVFIGYGTAVKCSRNVAFKFFSTFGFITSLFLFKCFSTMATVAIFFIIKLCTTSFNMVCVIVLPEIYPTSFRNMACGVVNSAGKVGMLVGSGAVYALYYYTPLAVVIFFVVSVFVVMTASWIWDKETTMLLISDVRDQDITEGQTDSLDEVDSGRSSR